MKIDKLKEDWKNARTYLGTLHHFYETKPEVTDALHSAVDALYFLAAAGNEEAKDAFNCVIGELLGEDR